jgi:hypothetical protein
LDKLKKIIMVLTEGLLDVNIVNHHDVWRMMTMTRDYYEYKERENTIILFSYDSYFVLTSKSLSPSSIPSCVMTAMAPHMDPCFSNLCWNTQPKQSNCLKQWLTILCQTKALLHIITCNMKSYLGLLSSVSQICFCLLTRWQFVLEWWSKHGNIWIASTWKRSIS